VQRFAEVGVQSTEERGFASFDGRVEPAELVEAESDRARGAGLEMLALPNDQGRAIHEAG
jgi:hypothetical protein